MTREWAWWAPSGASSPIRCGDWTTQTACSTWAHGARTARLRRSRAAAGGAGAQRGRYEYVVTTPARDAWHPKRLAPLPESRWTGSDRAAQLVLSHRARGQPIAVYRIRGRMHPGDCPPGHG